MLQALQEAAAHRFSPLCYPWGTPGSGEGKGAHCVLPLVAFSEALLMQAQCRQLVLERQEGGNVLVCMPRRII